MEAGLKYTSTITVTESNTACALGSGDLAVFATPAMVALMENAAMLAVAHEIGDDNTTVGTRIETSHLRATGLGREVRATAVLREVDNRRLVFDIVAEDDNGKIGEGFHERFIVDRERFLSKL